MPGLEPGHWPCGDQNMAQELKCPLGYSCTILFLLSWLYVPMASFPVFHQTVTSAQYFCALSFATTDWVLFPFRLIHGSCCLVAPAYCFLFSACFSVSAPCCQTLIISSPQIKTPPKKGWASKYPVCDCRGFEELGTDQGKRHDYWGSNTQKSLLSSAWTWLNESGSLLWHETVWRLIAQETLSRRRGEPGNSPGRREIGEGVYLSRWCHSSTQWGVSGLENSKRQEQLGAL